MNKLAANSRRENKAAGAYITVSTAGAERVRAFIPAPLPPRLELAGLQRAFDSALLAGGRAKAMMEATPDGDFFVRSGPGTVKLAPDSAVQYIRTRFAPV